MRRVPEEEGGTVWAHGKRSLGRSHLGELGLEGLREMRVCPRREYRSRRGDTEGEKYWMPQKTQLLLGGTAALERYSPPLHSEGTAFKR